MKSVYQTDLSSYNGVNKITTWKRIKKAFMRDRFLWLLVMPGVLWYLLFAYGPMYGLIIAFKDFQPFKGLAASPWVGFQWFEQFFKTFYFWRLLRNTLLLNIYSLIWGFPAPIIFALLLNEIQHKKFKRISQTISYLPYFLSTVVVVGIVVNFVSPTSGLINTIITSLGGNTIHFIIMPEWFRTLYISSDIWQGLGWGSIIYLAALSGIPTELYEAATMDGANRLQKVWHVTLPSIAPTIIILLILSLGGMLSVGYEKIILLYNAQTYETADVINSYVYRRGVAAGEYSFGTAVGLFQNVINFILIVIVNKVSKKVSEVSLW